MSAGQVLRTGSIEDFDAVMALMDKAVAWLVEHGRTGQWGDQPWSTSEKRVAQLRRMVEENELLLLEEDGAAIAALAHGPTAHDYVPPATGPEDYVLLLVSDPAVRGALTSSST